MLGCPKGKVLEDTGVGRDLVIAIRPPVCLGSCPPAEFGGGRSSILLGDYISKG